jgi:transposase-like protein
MSKTATATPQPADPETALPRRRTFTGEYRAAVLAECDAATEPGAIGAILRREGLYSSHLVDWRRRRAEGGLSGLAPKKTGRPPKDQIARGAENEIARLRRENAALEEKLRRSQIIVEAQKKLAEVLVSLAPPPSEHTG